VYIELEDYQTLLRPMKRINESDDNSADDDNVDACPVSEVAYIS